MQQNASYSHGGTGSPEISRMTTAPVTLRMRTMPENSGPKVEFTCLSLGGMIKATVPENLHIASVDPEPGVGYGWSLKTKDTWKTGFRKIARVISCNDSGFGETPCS